MIKREIAAFLAVCIFCLLSCSHKTDAFFLRFQGQASSSALPPATPPATVCDVSIRIRKTVESDVPYIAELLAKAVVRKRGGVSKWRNRMDEMFAKADIESLLRGRLHAMNEGQAAWKKVCRIYAHESEEDRLKILWATSDKFRKLVEKASKDTGEDNLWQTHNFVLTPPDLNWFNHLQLTAEDVDTGTIVGFCEVAMLSNPARDGTCRVSSAVVGDEDDDDERVFSPGITNLATAHGYRRQGVASRLLQHTERYVSMYWKAERMGLYVEKANHAAMALYSKLGYTSEVTCDGGDVLGELWYMVKDIGNQKSGDTTGRETEYSIASKR